MFSLEIKDLCLDGERCHVKAYFWEQLERSSKHPNRGETCLDNLVHLRLKSLRLAV